MLKNIFKNTDYVVLLLVLILFVIGLFGIYSAGFNSEVNKDEYVKQIVWFSIMFIVMSVIWTVSTNLFEIFGYGLYILSVILLVMVLYSSSLMGARSWFNFGGFLYQPSEIMKIGFIIVFSKILTTVSQQNLKSKTIKFVIGFISFALPVALILLQPDFGTAMAFFVISLFMLFVSGIKYRYIFAMFAIILILVPIIYFFVLNPTQQERILVFLDPSKDPLGSGYNAIQSKIAVGSGKFLGTGLLKGTQTQYGYLPIKSSDFIFSALSEELGFVISSLIVIVFLVLIIRLILVARNAPNQYLKLIVIGITGMIFYHFVQNIGMTIGLLPITGVPLPFVSYGGSNLMTNMIALGIILNISARKNLNMFID